MNRRQVIKAILAGCATPVVAQVLPNFKEALAMPEEGEEPSPVPTEVQHQLDHNRYCNALVLATAWEKSVDEAKSYLDEHYQDQPAKILDALADARKKIHFKADTLCGEAHIYRYEQLESIAQYWKVDVFTGKARVNTMLFNNQSLKLERVMQTANKRFPPNSASAQAATAGGGQDFYETFQARYDYCDAEVLGYHWSVEVSEAKSKMVENGDRYVQNALKRARKDKELRSKAGLICDYQQQFSYQDIERLSARWKRDMDQTKLKVSELMILGRADKVKAILKGEAGQAKKGSAGALRVRKGAQITSPAQGAKGQVRQRVRKGQN